MTRTARILFGAAILIFIGTPLLLSIGPIFGPIHDYYGERSDLKKYLESCPADELRLVTYYDRNGTETATLNFRTKSVEGGDSDAFVKWFWWGKTVNYFANMRLGNGPLTNEVLRKIKSLLAALPPSEASGTDFDPYRDRFHLAFYENGRPCIYHYAQEEARPRLGELCQALNVPFHHS